MRDELSLLSVGCSFYSKAWWFKIVLRVALGWLWVAMLCDNGKLYCPSQWGYKGWRECPFLPPPQPEWTPRVD